MDLDRVAFDEHGLKRLDAHAVERRGAIEQDGVLVDAFFENVPDLGVAALEHFLGRLDGVGRSHAPEPADDEGADKGSRAIFLGRPHWWSLSSGADDDDRTGRVVDAALPSRFSPEAALLAFDHVRQALERTVGRAQHGAAATAVVEQGVDGLLKHTLLVTDDDFGGVEVDQLLEPVVAVDDAAVEVVKVAGGKIAAFQQDQRTENRAGSQGSRP